MLIRVGKNLQERKSEKKEEEEEKLKVQALISTPSKVSPKPYLD